MTSHSFLYPGLRSPQGTPHDSVSNMQVQFFTLLTKRELASKVQLLGLQSGTGGFLLVWCVKFALGHKANLS